MKSLLSYTDIEYAGFAFENTSAEYYDTLPAVKSTGIPPHLDNVNIMHNFGDGLKLSEVANEAGIINCKITKNGRSGIVVSTLGTGRVYIDGTESIENGVYGIEYNGNMLPEDTRRLKFCGANRTIDNYVYLEHITDASSPDECIQVIQVWLHAIVELN